MTAAIDFRGVGVTRSGHVLLADIDWRVAEGERWVILGPNGAGKSTLLEIAAARSQPTFGTAELLGCRLGRTDVFELRPRIGVASLALADKLPAKETALDAVVTAAWAVTGRWREEYDPGDLARAEEMLDLLGVSHLRQRTVGTLSEGERKRVMIARALMTDPELLLLDEPAAGLDVGAREDLVRRLGELAVDPYAPTMVLVTHHLEEIPPGFTHVLMLAGGRAVASGQLAQTLTAANLSATFGLPLTVARFGPRWTVRFA